jgi:hypothetical protein
VRPIGAVRPDRRRRGGDPTPDGRHRFAASGELLLDEVEVLRAWKGAKAGDRVKVRSDESTCGVDVPTGAPALIYATAPSEGGQQVFRLSYCGENRVVVGADIAAEERRLGAPSSAVAPPPRHLPIDAVAAHAPGSPRGEPVRHLRARRAGAHEPESLDHHLRDPVDADVERSTRPRASTHAGDTERRLRHRSARGDQVLVFLDQAPLRFWPDFLTAYASAADRLPILSGAKASAAFATLRRGR